MFTSLGRVPEVARTVRDGLLRSAHRRPALDPEPEAQDTVNPIDAWSGYAKAIGAGVMQCVATPVRRAV